MLKAIVVVDEKWNIGKDGDLLVHLPKDLKRFKEITQGQFIIMGRKTLESLPGGKPLPQRTNIVLTRDKNYKNENVIVVNSFDALFKMIDILSQTAPDKDFIVCGGGEIYKALLNNTSEVAVTKIHHNFEGADTQFPNLDKNTKWESEFIGSEQDAGYTTSLLFYRVNK